MSNGLNSYMYDYFKRGYYRSSSQFGEQVSVQRTPIIELNSSYGTSNLRDEVITTGTGSQTEGDGEIILETGATASSTIHLDSSEVGRYIPGYGAEIGIGFRLDALPTGTQEAIWGGHDSAEENGIFFGHDSTGLYCAIRRDSVTTKYYQSNWNIDKLDGTGESGLDIDPTTGRIYQINFTWYGYGQIQFGVLAVIDKRQMFVPCHELSGFEATSIISPNLQIHIKLDNNDEAANLKGYVGGRQYSIVGNYIPKNRFTGQWRGSVSTSTTVKPLVSFRRKTGFSDRSIKLQGYDAIATTEPCIIEIRINATLTGESWQTPTNYSASETALETDISATAVTGGEVVWTQAITAGQNKNSAQLSQEEVDFDIPNGQNVSLCVRTFTSTGTVLSCLRMREEWVLVFLMLSFLFSVFTSTGIA